MDHYHIDAANYSLQRFKGDIASRDLIPSRRPLKDDLDERFKILENNGIGTLKQLIEALKTKSKLVAYSEKTGLPIDYLTLLRREANSYLPNPVRLDRFPGVPAAYVKALAGQDIKNSRQLFNAAVKEDERNQLALHLDLPFETLIQLVCLSDLVRAYGIGPVFARLLYDLGIKTISGYIEHSAQELISLYEEKEGKKADFGFDELQFSIDLAKNLYAADDL